MALQEQAKACAIGTRLAMTELETDAARTREDLAARAKALLSHVDEFEKEHPGSAFTPLHAEKKRRLLLAEGQTILATGDCAEVLGYFAKHGDALFDPGLGEYRWLAEEKKSLGRCAALC